MWIDLYSLYWRIDHVLLLSQIVLSFIIIFFVYKSLKKLMMISKKIAKSKKTENVLLNVHLKIFQLLRHLPKNKEKFIFMNTHSNEFNGNLKAVHDALVKATEQRAIKIYFRDDTDLVAYKKSGKIMRVMKMHYHICTASYVFLNDYVPLFARVQISPKTELIQLWHAGGAFKKFAKDSLQNIKNAQFMKNCTMAHGQYTLSVVSSAEIVGIYAEAFGVPEQTVKPLGLPRADRFFDSKEIHRVKEKLYKRYPKFKGKTVILYAPTYRDHEKTNFSLKLDVEQMCHLLGEEYVIILKMHPFIKKGIDIPGYLKGRVVELGYEDINELMMLADILISDYSSLIFEYAIMIKPMIFYAYDLDEYDSVLRGFYYDYRSFVPGPIFSETEQIIEYIQEGKWDLEEVRTFAHRFNTYFDGRASERIIEEILNK